MSSVSRVAPLAMMYSVLAKFCYDKIVAATGDGRLLARSDHD